MAPKRVQKLNVIKTLKVKQATPKKATAPKKLSSVSVLLAETWDGASDVTGWWVSEKLDGVRAFWNGEAFYSRAGNKFPAPDWFTADLPKNQELDGELFLARGQFQKCVGHVKKSVDEEWKLLKYQVFDACGSAVNSKPFEQRQEIAKNAISGCKYASLVSQTKATPAKGQSVMDYLGNKLKAIEALGGEGLMLRQPGSVYERKRSKTLKKIKSFFDLDAVVVGSERGKGANANRLGALHCKDVNGNQFKVGTGFTEKQRENPPKVGDIITIKYQEKTNAGLPRFPVFLRARTDIAKLQK
jgi:DNA ligase-1